MRLIWCLVFLLFCRTNGKTQLFSENALRSHIGFLASDQLKGRGTSTEGEKAAAEYIAAQFKKAGLSQLNGSYLRPFSYRRAANPHDTADASGPLQNSNNVVGYLNNKAPYTVVIGAHYDHLGLGHDKNSLDPNPEGKIHNGADDNASGTAGVIELASYFAANRQTEPFNFLFICFSGEELGLLGSKKWCEQPDIPLASVNYMINMDMIGRLNDSTQKLIVYGVGTSTVFVPLIDSLSAGFSVKKDSAGVGPSDQTSYYLKDIPVLHFFTGQHTDYHKPGDDLEKINFRGEARVLELIVKLIEHTYAFPKMQFLKTRTPETGKTSFKITMGVMPDYAFEGKGMRIDGVTDNKPASRAGIQKGDVVMKFGNEEVTDVMSYMKALSKFNKGDTVPVEVERNGRRIVLQVTF